MPTADAATLLLVPTSRSIGRAATNVMTHRKSCKTGELLRRSSISLFAGSYGVALSVYLLAASRLSCVSYRAE